MDKIKITDMEVFAHHGVLPEETKKGQLFLVSLTAYVSPATSDNLEDTLDYSEMMRAAKDFLTQNTFKLIERAADSLAYALLAMYKHKMSKICVEIKKPSAPVEIPFGNISVEIERGWHTAYISLGSNLGDRQSYIESAADAFLFMEDCVLLAMSEIFETKPYGKVQNQPDFLNACIQIKTLLPPEKLLERLQSIEDGAGRVRTVPKGERTLDLDLLMYDDLVLDTKKLTLPHPDMQNRRFVLEPLAQIAPDATHPKTGKSIRRLFEELK